MNERDELAKLIFDVPSEDPACIPSPRAIADAILAAGYRKLRTITTVEELEALPEDSIIHEGESVVATRIGNSWWYPTGPFEPNLPVTVLYNPEERG
ncbi:hypothetical protein ACRAJ3_11475 [Rhodococcus pyridinivorans]|uniref:hypothetical protein n=1 Tax=Rhodococcus pyridinivorans TaxID=103816 RepID=UPI003D7FE01A